MEVKLVAFAPTRLVIPKGGSANLRVVVQGIVEAGDAGRKVNVNLFDSDTFADDFLDRQTTILPTDLKVGDLHRETFNFVLSCVDGHVTGPADSEGNRNSSGESEAELEITFGPAEKKFGGCTAVCEV